MNDDKIYDAYSGKKGSDVQQDAKIRIEWILSQAGSGKRILDCGCSQGIISLLAACQDNDVLGIDLNEGAIEFANELKKTEYEQVAERVRFEVKDFFEYTCDKSYDCILLCEVLEHLEHPEVILKHLAELLANDGRIVITVPFGYMPHPDHKVSYYLTKLYSIVDAVFEILDFVFLGHWMGLVAKSKEEESQLTLEMLYPVQEQHFLKLEQESREKYMTVRNNILECSKKYRQAGAQFTAIQEQLKECREKEKEEEPRISSSELTTQMKHQEELLSAIEMLIQLENSLNMLDQKRDMRKADRMRMRFQWLAQLFHVQSKEEEDSLEEKKMSEFIRNQIHEVEKKLEQLELEYTSDQE